MNLTMLLFNTHDTNQFAIVHVLHLFQVRFNSLSSVVSVATRGDGCCFWVTMYRLATSVDCSTFNNLLDDAGNNVVIDISCYNKYPCFKNDN